MERWYRQHQAAIFFIAVTASIVTYAYTNFSTKAEVADKVTSIKERLDLIDKRLERIEDAIIKGK